MKRRVLVVAINRWGRAKVTHSWSGAYGHAEQAESAKEYRTAARLVHSLIDKLIAGEKLES